MMSEDVAIGRAAALAFYAHQELMDELADLRSFTSYDFLYRVNDKNLFYVAEDDVLWINQDPNGNPPGPDWIHQWTFATLLGNTFLPEGEDVMFGANCDAKILSESHLAKLTGSVKAKVWKETVEYAMSHTVPVVHGWMSQLRDAVLQQDLSNICEDCRSPV